MTEGQGHISEGGHTEELGQEVGHRIREDIPGGDHTVDQ